MDEDHLVALAVPEEVLHPLGGAAERDLDVAVPHQQPAAGDLVALGLDALGVHDPVLMGVRHPLLALDRLEVADLLARGRATGGGRGSTPFPGEALQAHHLLGQEGAVVAELDVRLRGTSPRRW